MNAGKSYSTLRSHSLYRILDLFRQVRSVTEIMSIVLEPPKTHPKRRLPWNHSECSEFGKLGNKIRWSKARELYELGQSTAEVAQELAQNHSRPSPGIIALMRRAVRRYVQMAIASTDSVEIQRLMASAREAFDMERALLGKEPLASSKRKSKPLLPSDFPLPDSGNQSVPTPIAKPASDSQPPVTDDTPF